MPRAPRQIQCVAGHVGVGRARDDKIVAILDLLLSPFRVREWVELFYLNSAYGVGEHIYYALHREKEPHAAVFTDGQLMRWPPVISCGHHPFHMAHLVECLTVERHEDGTETATCKDVRSKRWHMFTNNKRERR